MHIFHFNTRSEECFSSNSSKIHKFTKPFLTVTIVLIFQDQSIIAIIVLKPRFRGEAWAIILRNSDPYFRDACFEFDLRIIRVAGVGFKVTASSLDIN
jgi:hypothetical protein